jgi:hypothetical protein
VSWDEVGGEWSEFDEESVTGDEKIKLCVSGHGVVVTSGTFGGGMFFLELNGPETDVKKFQKAWDAALLDTSVSYGKNLDKILKGKI